MDAVEFHIEPFRPGHETQVLELSIRAWAPVFAGFKRWPVARYFRRL